MVGSVSIAEDGGQSLDDTGTEVVSVTESVSVCMSVTRVVGGALCVRGRSGSEGRNSVGVEEANVTETIGGKGNPTVGRRVSPRVTLSVWTREKYLTEEPGPVPPCLLLPVESTRNVW